HHVCATDHVAGTEDLHTIQSVTKRLAAGSVDANQVALNDIVADAIGHNNAVAAAATTTVPGNDVAGRRAGRGREPANLGGARYKNSVAKSQRMRAGDVRADEIALNTITGRGTDANASVIGANHIARRGNGAADQVVARSDIDACTVGDGIDAGRVGADEVALH